MIKAREQFIAEKEQQGKQLQQLVDEMKRYSDLMQTAEDVCREKGTVFYGKYRVNLDIENEKRKTRMQSEVKKDSIFAFI